MNDLKRLTGVLAVLALFVGAAGCSSRTAKKKGPQTTTAGIEDGAVLPDEDEPSVRNSTLESIPQLETIHFDFDSSQLSAEAQAILTKNAQWLKENPEARVQVTGHCDQRGTVSYNLALGQRRARSVREFYRRVGIRGARVATISYGEEKLACAEETEACWQKNRRGETLLATPRSNARGQGRGVTP